MQSKQPAGIKIILAELDPGGYHLFINLKVNGKKCRFLIDTGASKSVIAKDYYDKHLSRKKLKVIKQETTGLHSTVSETHIGVIKDLELGKQKVKNLTVAAIDLNHVNGVYKVLKQPKIQGILGSDLMFKYKMVIDYGQQRIFIP